MVFNLVKSQKEHYELKIEDSIVILMIQMIKKMFIKIFLLMVQIEIIIAK